MPETAHVTVKQPDREFVRCVLRFTNLYSDGQTLALANGDNLRQEHDERSILAGIANSYVAHALRL